MTDHDQEQQSEHGPIRITDKREQRRQEAADRAAAAQHPVVTPPPLETVDEALGRVDRIQQLQDKGRLPAGLTSNEQADLLELQALEQQAMEAQQEQDGESIDVLTAFVVFVGHDGSARASSDMNAVYSIDREANVDDMFSGCSLVVRDINASMASKHTVFGLQVSAQAMSQQAQAAKMMQGLNTTTGRHR